jgi:urease subunit gamma/beta
MALTPGERDRLLLFTQAELARVRRARGLRLNIPEARALIADSICEWARDGLPLTEVRALGGSLLTVDDVLPDVPGLIGPVQVEARFDDGTRLVVVDPAIANDSVPSNVSPRPISPISGVVRLTNEASTAIGITSHVHLAEVNPRIRVDRAAAFGRRLAIAAGETLWLQPGEAIEAPVAEIAGARVAMGTTGLVDGPLDDPAVRDRALTALRACGYLDEIDGVPSGSVTDADDAIANVLAHRESTS